MPKKKPLVLGCNKGKNIDKAARQEGINILSGKKSILVKYKGKNWDLNDLVQYLAKRVKELEKNQCSPSAKCLFKGQEYLENKYSKSLPHDYDWSGPDPMY